MVVPAIGFSTPFRSPSVAACLLRLPLQTPWPAENHLGPAEDKKPKMGREGLLRAQVCRACFSPTDIPLSSWRCLQQRPTLKKTPLDERAALLSSEALPVLSRSRLLIPPLFCFLTRLTSEAIAFIQLQN